MTVALPAPRIDVFLLSAQTVSEKADTRYAEICTARKKYGVSNGLQQLFARENECALPVWQGTEFGFGFLRQGGAAVERDAFDRRRFFGDAVGAGGLVGGVAR